MNKLEEIMHIFGELSVDSKLNFMFSIQIGNLHEEQVEIIYKTLKKIEELQELHKKVMVNDL